MSETAPPAESTQDARDLVHCRVEGHVGLPTIHRPEVLNAMNTAMVARLHEVLDQVEADDDVHVIVFTGAGDRAFVAGADIAEIALRRPADGLQARMQRLHSRIHALDTPTIAAVNGYALGGGFELALACDIRIASARARFALPETGVGILPAAGGSQRLARIVGIGWATEMILTGRRIDAEEALHVGLITAVVEPEALLDTALETARTVASRGPLANRLAVSVLEHALDSDRETGLLLERLAVAVLYSHTEKEEGTAAFLEKRPPHYRN